MDLPNFDNIPPWGWAIAGVAVIGGIFLSKRLQSGGSSRSSESATPAYSLTVSSMEAEQRAEDNSRALLAAEQQLESERQRASQANATDRAAAEARIKALEDQIKALEERQKSAPARVDTPPVTTMPVTPTKPIGNPGPIKAPIRSEPTPGIPKTPRSDVTPVTPQPQSVNPCAGVVPNRKDRAEKDNVAEFIRRAGSNDIQARRVILSWSFRGVGNDKLLPMAQFVGNSLNWSQINRERNNRGLRSLPESEFHWLNKDLHDRVALGLRDERQQLDVAFLNYLWGRYHKPYVCE